MDKNIDFIVDFVGDERMTLKQIMHKLNGRCSVANYNKSNVYHWLLRYVRTVMLDGDVVSEASASTAATI